MRWMRVCWRRGSPLMRCTADTALRSACQHRGVGYVLAGARNHYVVTAQCRVDALVAGMPTFGWQPLSAGPGSKGPRLYSWLLINIASTLPGSEWIMMRCNDSTHELAYYRCWSPHPVPLRTGRQDARRDQRGHPVGHRHHSTRSGRGWPWVGRVRRLLPRERQLAALCKHRHGE